MAILRTKEAPHQCVDPLAKQGHSGSRQQLADQSHEPNPLSNLRRLHPQYDGHRQRYDDHQHPQSRG